MTTTSTNRNTTATLIDSLRSSDAYPNAKGLSVVLHETHISWVFLVGEFAYKIKKPITTHFLDYGTLQKRHDFCLEEVRLDSRYAPDLYLGVVPITIVGGKPRVEGAGQPIEFAVKMRRFPDGALLSDRLKSGQVTSQEVLQLATVIADFHHQAARLRHGSPWGKIDSVLENANANLVDLTASATVETLPTLRTLESWTESYFTQHQTEFGQRVANGFIRECHGDLHLSNIVRWNDQWIPFDGIEFSEDYRWIDVMSDAAFLAMDFAANGHLESCRSFINAYLDQTGDHASLALLRWYLVYRALVRGKVAKMRAEQSVTSELDRQSALSDCKDHIDLAYRFTLTETPELWITHGLSGSGKTTASELVVQRRGAIRLRSDMERKRHFGLSGIDRPNEKMKQKMYCDSGHAATYGRLRRLASHILRAGYSVIVDATFLKRHDRESFQQLARDEGVAFGILDCHADQQTLRQRIADRMSARNDPSDADTNVLTAQLAFQEPLTSSEREQVVTIPETCPATGQTSSIQTIQKPRGEFDDN